MIRLKHQRHPLAFHLRITLDLAHKKQLLLDLGEQDAAQVQVRHLTALEAQSELNLVAFLQEVAGAVHLDLKIVIAYANGVDIDLLKATGARGCARFVFLLLLLIAPFAIIHDSANRRAGRGSYLNQVETCLARHAQRIVRGNDPNLLLLVIDQADRGNPDLLVVAKIRRNGVCLLYKPLPNPMRLPLAYTSGPTWRF